MQSKYSRNVLNSLATKFKSYEQIYGQNHLTANHPWIVRLDGVSFKRFTEGLNRPFDDRISAAFAATAADLLQHFQASTAFTQSDEITLSFPPQERVDMILYSGRVQKIVSVLASFAAARFNYYLARHNWSDQRMENDTPNALLQQRMLSGQAFFDARAFSLPSDVDVAEAFLWRHQYDCRRNAIHTIGRSYLSHKTLQHMNLTSVATHVCEITGAERIENLVKPWNMYGTFLKKRLSKVDALNPKTSKRVITWRGIIEARVFDWTFGAEQLAPVVMSKYWPFIDEDAPEQSPISEILFERTRSLIKSEELLQYGA